MKRLTFYILDRAEISTHVSEAEIDSILKWLNGGGYDFHKTTCINDRIHYINRQYVTGIAID